MTEISFYFSAPSRTGYACRLVRQAQRQGMALAVTGPAAALAEFDRELWSFAGPEFVPHGPIERLAEVPATLHASTVWLTADALAAPRHEALVNLGAEPPAGFETFARVFETKVAGVRVQPLVDTGVADRGRLATRRRA